MNEASTSHSCLALCFGICWEYLTDYNYPKNYYLPNTHYSIPKQIWIHLVAVAMTLHRHIDLAAGRSFDPFVPPPPSGIKLNKSRYLYKLTPSPVSDHPYGCEAGRSATIRETGGLNIRCWSTGQGHICAITLYLQPVKESRLAGFIWQKIKNEAVGHAGK
jgi:hypothetical protein